MSHELKEIASFYGYRAYHACWSNCSKYIASASIDQVDIWEVSGAKRTRKSETFHVYGGEISAICWLGNRVFVGSKSGELFVLNPKRRGYGQKIGEITGGSQIAEIKGVDQILVTRSEGGTFTKWDADKLKQISTMPRKMKKSSFDSMEMAMYVQPNPGGGSNDVFIANRFGEVWSWTDVPKIVSKHQVGNNITVVAIDVDSCVAWGSRDGIITILKRDSKLMQLYGHTGSVTGLNFRNDGKLLVSSSTDDTIRIWDVEEGKIKITIDALYWPTTSFASFSPDSKMMMLLIGERFTDEDYSEQTKIASVFEIPEVMVGPSEQTLSYKRAKVVLLGNSGVGKTCLGEALVGKDFAAAESTQRPNIHCLNRVDYQVEAEFRETLLWDLGGQPGYRVTNHLHLNDVSVAAMIFDSKDAISPFAGVSYWSQAVNQAARTLIPHKILVAARVDRGGLAVSQQRLDDLMKREGFQRFIATSSKRHEGIEELRQEINNAIDWDALPAVTAPQLFHEIKAFLISSRDRNPLVLRSDLFNRFVSQYSFESKNREQISSLQKRFDICLLQLETVGVAKSLHFGGWVVLRPDLLEDYCASIALAARDEPDGLGFIPEMQVLEGNFKMDSDRFFQSNQDMEKLMLNASLQETVGRGIAFREETDRGNMIVFPSELRADMPDYPGNFVPWLKFDFYGPISAIYATLAVRIINSIAFKKERLYKNALICRSAQEQLCGIRMELVEASDETKGSLTVFFGPDVSKDVKLLFLRYVNQQLAKLAFSESVTRHRIYQCPCTQVLNTDGEIVRRRIERGDKDLICPVCERKTPIDDLRDSLDSTAEVEILNRNSDLQINRHARKISLGIRKQEELYDIIFCHEQKERVYVERISRQLRDEGILAWHGEGNSYDSEEAKRILDKNPRIPKIGIVHGPSGTKNWRDTSYSGFVEMLHRDWANKLHKLTFFTMLVSKATRDFQLIGLETAQFDFTDPIKYQEELKRLVLIATKSKET